MQISTVTNLKTNKIEKNMGVSPLVDRFIYEKDLGLSSIPNPNYNKGVDDESLEEIQIPVIHQLRVVYQQSMTIQSPSINKNSLSIAIIKEPFEKKIKINNTFDLHDYILHNSSIVDVNLNNANIDAGMILPVFINREANNIAMCTRRGAGNVCIISNYNFSLINKESIDQSIDDNCYNYSNTYEYKGSIGGVKYYVDKTGLLSDEYIIVTYNGNMLGNKTTVQDSGLIAIVDNNNDAWLSELKNSSTALGNCSDYYRVLKIKR